MRCFTPLDAYQPDGEFGDRRLVFSERAGYSPITIRCGQCIGCRLAKSKTWGVRCMHENQMHADSSFITLTFNDEHLPLDCSLHYRDFQLFIKRLRKYFSHVDDYGNLWRLPIRYFMCGEYGSLRKRPHFHACVFGCFFSDRVLFSRLSSGSNLYTSKILDGLWSDDDGKSIGFASVGDVTFESAAYVARYITKKVFGDVANEHSAYRYVDDYGEVHYRSPEFAHMSLKPGIGAKWFERYYKELFPRDHVIVAGRKCSVPKYYDRLLAADHFDLDFVDLDTLDFSRFEKAMRSVVDASSARLEAQRVVAESLLSFKCRTLE